MVPLHRSAVPRALPFSILALAVLGQSVPLAGQTDASNPDPPRFSVARGHYDEAFPLVITAPVESAALVVTVDGSVPGSGGDGEMRVTPDDPGTLSTVDLLIEGTTSVRALAILPGGERSAVATHSYVFPDDVLRQTAPERRFERWGHSGPDWEMDPDVVAHDDPGSRVAAGDLLSVPALYLSLPFDDFWGRDGIYIEGEGDERPVSVELLNPTGDPDDPNAVGGLQVDGTVEVTGGSSTDRWKTDKLSLRLRFRGGTDFPVFAGAAGDARATDRFHTLILDARLNESWLHPEPEQQIRGQHTRDQFLADLQNATGGLAPHGRHVHLYVAGLYWGLYTLHERPDHHFAESYRGGDSSDWTVFKHDKDDVVHGDDDAFDDLLDLVDDDVTSADGWRAVQAALDVEDFARYMLLNFWAGNTDWAHQNWYASVHPDLEDARWRFHSWDAEHTLKELDDDVTAKDDPEGPTHIHRRLMENPAYREVFAAVVEDARRGGILDPAFTADLYRKRSDEIDRAVRAESARWGDNRRARPYTRAGEWAAERDRLLQRYLPRRAGVVLEQLRAAGWIR